jgi:hypothetical protein
MVDAIWKAVEGLGFDGGVVLEPGAGSGNFIGHAPSNAHMIGVELDPVTAGIAHYLYPDASIRRVVRRHPDARGLRRRRRRQRAVREVRGQRPQVQREAAAQHPQPLHHQVAGADQARRCRRAPHVPLHDGRRGRQGPPRDGEVRRPRHRRPPPRRRAQEGRRHRRHHRPARVPAPRRRPGPGGDQSWIESSKADINGHEIPVNNYFQNNPGQVLGEVTTGRGQFSDHDLVGQGQGESTRSCRRPSPAPCRRAGPATRTTASARPRTSGPSRTGSRRCSTLAAPAAKATSRTRTGSSPSSRTAPSSSTRSRSRRPRSCSGSSRCGTSRRRLLSEEAQHEQDTPRIQQLRKALNDAYDEYVREHGPINRFTWTTRKNPKTGEETQSRLNPQQGAFRKDPSSALVYALEKFDPETGTATKASIMSERVVAPRKPVEHADTPTRPSRSSSTPTATPTSARSPGCSAPTRRRRGNGSAGSSTTTRTTRSGSSPPPSTCRGTSAPSSRAREAAAAGGDRFQANVDALEQVLPKDLLPGEIDGRLGAAWIGHEDVQQFLQEITGDRYLKVKHPGGSLWDVEGGSYGIAARNQYGTDRMPAGKLAQKLLQQKPIEVFDTSSARTPTAGTSGSSTPTPPRPRRRRPPSCRNGSPSGCGRTRSAPSGSPRSTTRSSTPW